MSQGTSAVLLSFGRAQADEMAKSLFGGGLDTNHHTLHVYFPFVNDHIMNTVIQFIYIVINGQKAPAFFINIARLCH